MGAAMTAKGSGAREGLPRLLSLRAVSEQTTIPRSTLYTLIARGDLPAIRLGRSVRISERDLLDFIEGHREVAPV